MDDAMLKINRLLSNWNLMAASPPRTVFHFAGMSIFTRRRLRPWFGMKHNRITGRTMYMAGLLYFAAVMSNPFK